MEDIKKLLVYFRNALAFSYSWLVLCSALVGIIYAFAFFSKIMRKRGFVFDLTVFFVLFIPVEILMFYWMDIFTGSGSAALWTILGIFVLICYITCILIDVFIMRKRSKVYTDKLNEYNSRKQAG